MTFWELQPLGFGILVGPGLRNASIGICVKHGGQTLESLMKQKQLKAHILKANNNVFGWN